MFRAYRLHHISFNMKSYCTKNHITSFQDKKNIRNKIQNSFEYETLRDEIEKKDHNNKHHLHKCISYRSKYKDEYLNRYLLENAETINYQDIDGKTALAYASEYDMDIEVEILLKHNANPNIQDKEGFTPLMHASKYSLKNVQALLNVNANVNLQNNAGYTALMISAINLRYHPKIFELLLEHSADIHLKSIYGTDVLSLCLRNKEDERIIRLIIERLSNCNIKVDGKKLIKHLYDNHYSEKLIELAVIKGAKLRHIHSRFFFF